MHPVFTLLALSSLLSLGCATTSSTSTALRNRELVQRSFDAWSAGTGRPFELVVPKPVDRRR